MLQNEDFFSESNALLKEIRTFENIKQYCNESSVWCNEQIKLRRDLLQQLVNEVRDSEY